MLFVLRRDQRPKEAAKKQERRSERYVTADDLEERLKDFQKEQKWVLDEWHDKFSTLHARLAKRQQRAAKQQQSEELELEEQPQGARSVLHLPRRIGSV